MARAPSLSAVLAYGAPALMLSFGGMPLYVHAPDFYATDYAVSLSLLGSLLLVLRLADAVIDPLIGYLSDRYPQRTYPIMAASAALLVAGFYLLFHPSAAHPLRSFTLGMLVATLAFSALGINLNRLGALWGTHGGMTKITTGREALGLLGLIVAVTLPGMLQQSMPKARAFHFTWLALVGIGALCWWAFHRWFRAHAPQEAQAATRPPSFWALTRHMPPPLRGFFAVYGLSMLASSIPGVLVMFFIRDRLGSEAYTGPFLLVYFLSGAACMPLWERLSRRYSPERSWMISMLLACASFVWAYTLVAGEVWQYGLICLASGAALGGELSMPPAILAARIRQAGAESGSATYFSLLAFLLKASLALSAALVLPYLDAGGFVPAGTNSPAALHRLSLAYALLPCFLKLGALLLLRRTMRADQPPNGKTAS